ncbi:MAG: DUF1289 domain-containing protein [Pseudomonadota bacterium]
MTVTSPCTGICKLDEQTGWCLGCGRTGDEIAVWRGLPQSNRDQVWADIPDRLGQLGVACRRLPWTTEDIREFVATSCAPGRGTWVMGVVGAVAEFLVTDGAVAEVIHDGDDLIARTQNGALRMTIDDHLRALTFDPPSLKTPPRVVLAVKRERGRLPVADGLIDLGEDQAALLGDKATRLFDLGLGRKEARFCVRVGDGAAHIALDRATGLPFADSFPQIGAALLQESPTRVVETALGRIEVQGQIPTESATMPAGPHTHLLPDQLLIGRALPVGMDLQGAYLPGANFYPKV